MRHTPAAGFSFQPQGLSPEYRAALVAFGFPDWTPRQLAEHSAEVERWIEEAEREAHERSRLRSLPGLKVCHGKLYVE